jgi:ADP-heptose:LPS heptosyltransferase
MRKVLVLRGGALGDFIVTLPALALLRQRWPDAHIELVGNATAAALALPSGLINRAQSQHQARWSTLYGGEPLAPHFATELRAFDLVLNFWPDPDRELTRRFPLRDGQTFLTAAALPARAPVASHYCAPLAALGLTTDCFWYSLAAPAAEARFVAIHPGSGSPKKNWPLARWSALGAWLTRELRCELQIITGEADSAAAEALARFGTTAHALPLAQLVVRLGQCRFFLGHDSGISHLAAACGVPSLLLFGPTDPAMWAPPAPHVTVLRPGTTLEAISLDDVQRAAHAALAPRS